MVVVTEWKVSPVKSQDPQAVVQRLMCPPSRKKTLAEVREVWVAQAICVFGVVKWKETTQKSAP